MNNVTFQLIQLYGYRCWLKGVIHKKHNPLTYHHIDPVRNGGARTICNGALLTRGMHDWFNVLESIYPDLADEINNYFLIYKGNYSEEVWSRIAYLLSLVEEEYHERYGYSKTKR